MKVYECLEKDSTLPLDVILNSANTSMDSYIKALKNSSKGTTVVLKRKPCEFKINPYNHDLMKAWQANMDIQFMKQLSRSVVFLNTNAAKERINVLKPLEDLKMMNDEDEDVFQKSIIDRYIHRPPELENMCFAEFGAKYTVIYKDENQDSLPLMSDNTSTLHTIKLTNNYGTMHKRSREAIIRFHQPNKDKNCNEFFRTKLMLYLPWRNESTDLLGGHRDYTSHYQHCQEIILTNEKNYTANLEDLTEYLQLLNETGPPQHVWSNLAPSVEANRIQDEADGYEL